MNVIELRPNVSAIEWSAGELVKLPQRLDSSIQKCRDVNREDPHFAEDCAELSALDALDQFMESAHILSVESMDLNNVYDVELAYVAWLAFRKLASDMGHARANGIS